MSLEIRWTGTDDPGAVLVEGIGAFSRGPNGELVPPDGVTLTDEDWRRIYAALPPGFEVMLRQDGPQTQESLGPDSLIATGDAPMPTPADPDPKPKGIKVPEATPTTAGGET